MYVIKGKILLRELGEARELDGGTPAFGHPQQGLKAGAGKSTGQFRPSAMVDQQLGARVQQHRRESVHLLAFDLHLDEHVEFGQATHQRTRGPVIVDPVQRGVEGDADDPLAAQLLQHVGRCVVR